jgi:hypothetical protein
MPKVSRRSVVGTLGGGLCALPFVGAGLVASPDPVEPPAARSPAAPAAPRTELLAPFTKGSRFARWTIADVSPLDRGAVTITVHGDDGHDFRLEILARDGSPLARRAPGETARFAIYVANGGDGWLPTVEEQGLAAMTLASILAKNEAALDAAGFLTHAERIARHRDGLLGA